MKKILPFVFLAFVVMLIAADQNAFAPEAVTPVTIFPTANKFTLTTNGLVVTDTNTASRKYRHRAVFRKGQFYTVTRGYSNGSFAIVRADGVPIVDRTIRGVQVNGDVRATAAGDSARILAIDLWNQ